MDALQTFVTQNELLIRIAASVILFVLFFTLRKRFTAIITKLTQKALHKKPALAAEVADSIKMPLHIFFALFGVFLATQLVNVSAAVTSFGVKALKIAVIFLICWAAVNMLDEQSPLLQKLKNADGNVNLTACKFISNLLRVAVFCIGFVIILNEFGYNITGVITGLGLGGLTLSLAAKDSIQNMISGFIVIFDKPFAVGDYISVAGQEGTVKDITMRSTKLSASDGTEIIIPNSTVTNSAIQNLSKISSRIVELNLKFAPAAPENLRAFEKDVRSCMETNEMLDSAAMRVTLSDLAGRTPQVSIWCPTKTGDIQAFEKIKEDINFALMQLAEKHGLTLAQSLLPTAPNNEEPK